MIPDTKFVLLCSFQMYVCEDCGHSTSDPEEHFRHLQQNHPFCPALQRCHDKRQFKFKMEQQQNNDGIGADNEMNEIAISVQKQAEVDGKTETDMAVAHLQSIEGNVDTNNEYLEREELDRKPGIERLKESQFETKSGTVHARLSSQTYSNSYVHPGMLSTESDIDIQTRVCNNRKQPEEGVIKTLSESTKRFAATEPTNVSPKKKLKSVYSPKKNKFGTSPTKTSPQRLVVSENRGDVSKYDIENVVSKKMTENVAKKRPLGSLTQNTINQQKNNFNSHLNDNAFPVAKKPLGSIMENLRW